MTSASILFFFSMTSSWPSFFLLLLLCPQILFFMSQKFYPESIINKFIMKCIKKKERKELIPIKRFYFISLDFRDGVNALLEKFFISSESGRIKVLWFFFGGVFRNFWYLIFCQGACVKINLMDLRVKFYWLWELMVECLCRFFFWLAWCLSVQFLESDLIILLLLIFKVVDFNFISCS